MFLSNIKVINFRNHASLNIDFNKNINIIVGNNALGKTNILESIYVLALSKTFRYAKDKELIKSGTSYFQIAGNINRESFCDNLKLNYDGSSKKLFINQEKVSKLADYISKINVIVFSPDDLDLIKSSPDVRRKFLNLEISQLFPNYCKVMSDYNDLLKIRNNYLKRIKNNEKVDKNYFSILEKYLIDKSIQIYKIRNKFLTKISNISNDIYLKTMEKEGFKIKYNTTPYINDFEDNNIRIVLEKAFADNHEEEIRFGSTMFGPHRDDFIFLLKDENIKVIGSQSQQKLAVLVLKLAEIELFFNQTNEYPLLLLDDIFSELDNLRKNNVLSYLRKDIQTFITTTDIENISDEIKNNAKVFFISDCKITEL